jgi:predicted Zn-dependent peptidase
MAMAKIQKTILPSGVRIVSERVSHVHSVSIGVWIRSGSRYEQKAESGIAHFIEHMLFKGTATYSAVEIARMIDSVGGVFNAFTSKEYTCFYVKVLTQHLDLAVNLLGDVFFHSLFQTDEIEKERNVILQEINMVKDTPDDYIQDMFNHDFFRGHPLGYNILGELDTVQNFQRRDITGFYRREYLVPERIVIAAAGNLDHEALVDRLSVKFNTIKKKKAAPAQSSFAASRSVTCNYRKLEQVHVCLGTPGCSHFDQDRYGLYVLNTILGGSMSSRLFQEIRENRGLAYSVYSFTASFFDTGVFGVYMGVVKDTVEESLKIVFDEMRGLQEKPVGAAELSAAKEQLKGNMLLAMESTDSRMSRIAKCEMYYNEYVPLSRIIKDIDAVTADNVRELARTLFKDDQMTCTFLGPLKNKDIQKDLLLFDQ